MKSMFSEIKVIAVDLDGTLAKYEGFHGMEHIGEPVPGMLRRVKPIPGCRCAKARKGS